jgi:hypothetical protein
MRAWSMFVALTLLGGALEAQSPSVVATGRDYVEFTIYYEGIEGTTVTRVSGAPIPIELGGEEEDRIYRFYQRSTGVGSLVLGIHKTDLLGMEQITFSLSGACGAHSIRKLGSTWDTTLSVAVIAGACKTKNVPPHTLPTTPACIYSTSWVPGDKGENDQKDAAIESLLAQLGIQDDVILALCSEPCPKPKSCMASNILSSRTDGVDKMEQDDPDAPGERRWKIKILNPGQANGWDGQVYCACLETTNQS